MYLDRIHRTSFKQRVFLCMCLLLVLYIFLFDSPFLSHIRVRLLSLGNFSAYGALYRHQIGQIVSNRNGSFLYFHLPSLNDFNIERDFYRLNSFGVQVKNDSIASKYCLRRGSAVADVQGQNQILCVCKSNYSGSECAIPSVVHQTVDQKITKAIRRLRRPRRILASLIWPTYEYEVFNQTNKELRLQKFADTLAMMSQYVDLFIIHEISIVPNATTKISDDQYSLANQFKKGLLVKHAMYTLLFSKSIVYQPYSKIALDLTNFEFEAVRKSWNLFSRQITEYRPADIILFLSIKNFPSESLLLYLKYHTGLTDIVHMMPIHLFSVHGNEHNSLTAYTSVDQEATPTKVNSFLDVSKVQLSSGNLYHLKNVITTFEYLTYLCRFNFDRFLANYCLTEQPSVDRFQANFWSINLVGVGSTRTNLSATFTIS